MAASLGWMSKNGLLPTPIDTISFKRISAGRKTNGWVDLRHRRSPERSAIRTFVPRGLGPQDSGDVVCPGVFCVRRCRLKDEGLILGCPPPEPDLKLQPAVPRRLCQTNVRRLQHRHTFSAQKIPRLTVGVGSPALGELTLKECL